MSEILAVDFSQNTQLTELELQILQRYQTLALRLNHLAQLIDKLIKLPSPQLLENLRVIESKIALVFTLFKAAVYSLFLGAGADEDEQEQHGFDALQESTSSFINH